MKTLTFEARFGFHTTPFTREYPVERRYSHPMFDEAAEALVRAVERRESAVLLAPSGTGKTGVLRTVQQQLPESRYRTSYLKVTGLSQRDLCRELATAVGASPAGSYPSLVRRLQERFVTLSETDGLRPVILLDEAHDFRPEVLGILRILTNFDMDSRLVVSLVLAGQLPLRQMLRRESLEDVAHRMAHLATLRTLSREETHAYVEHRLTMAGATTVPFDPAALEALFEIGRGNLRATDHLALKSLELTHQAGHSVVQANDLPRARKLLWP